MVLVPKDLNDIPLRVKLTQMLSPAGFGMYSFTTAIEHDRMIAFTSQLAHVVSNAYVKSPTAKNHKGFSAGSYKDLTRVAWLNEAMWTELFFENKNALTYEIDQIIGSLTEYRNALTENDRDKMKSLLRDGRIAKEEIDGKAEKPKHTAD
jgi:prephenate dehydrogenase